ncbi:MAG: hypothetical protein L0L09_13290, partial [Staphylococcus equorum]|nr:hypothetical protein [Staphylococcus equorum]
LAKLATLARKKTLFDDRPVEFQELSTVIKQKLKKITDQLKELGQFQRRQQQETSSGWSSSNQKNKDKSIPHHKSEGCFNFNVHFILLNSDQ